MPGNNQGHEFASQEIPPRSGGIHNAQTSRCRIGHRSWSSASRTNWCLRANLLQLRAHRYAISAKGCSICKSPYLRRRDPGMCVDCCSSARVARSRIHCSSTSYCCSSTPASHRGSPKTDKWSWEGSWVVYGFSQRRSGYTRSVQRRAAAVVRTVRIDGGPGKVLNVARQNSSWHCRLRFHGYHHRQPWSSDPSRHRYRAGSRASHPVSGRRCQWRLRPGSLRCSRRGAASANSGFAPALQYCARRKGSQITTRRRCKDRRRPDGRMLDAAGHLFLRLRVRRRGGCRRSMTMCRKIRDPPAFAFRRCCGTE